MQSETRSTPNPNGRGWIDHLGFLGPVKPGSGPRNDPTDDFPTGPGLGDPLPNIVTSDSDGRLIDLHTHRDGRPAVVVFFRSAVW